MIRPLRRRHALILPVLAALVIPLFLLALSQRPPEAIASLPAVLVSPPAATDAVRLTVEGTAVGLGVSVPVGGSQVEVRFSEPLRRPAVSLFCALTADSVDSQALPQGLPQGLPQEAVVVGTVRQGSAVQRLDLPAGCRGAGVQLYFYSFGHDEVFARAKLPADDAVAGGSGSGGER